MSAPDRWAGTPTADALFVFVVTTVATYRVLATACGCCEDPIAGIVACGGPAFRCGQEGVGRDSSIRDHLHRGVGQHCAIYTPPETQFFRTVPGYRGRSDSTFCEETADNKMHIDMKDTQLRVTIPPILSPPRNFKQRPCTHTAKPMHDGDAMHIPTSTGPGTVARCD